MVLSNVPRSAQTSRIVTRTNVCGGVKKAGLAPTVGVPTAVFPSIYIRGVNSIPLICMGNYTNPSQSALRAIRRY